MMEKTYARKAPQALKFLLIAAGAIAVIFYLISLKGKPAVTELQLDSSSAILIDLETGSVLYEKNANEALPPASMSKLMTELIILDMESSGQINWRDPVVTSAYAADVPGSQIGFMKGETFSVKELFEAMAVHSANDAAVALAEYVGGSEEDFVVMMNQRAQKLGLTGQTIFGNATGLSKSDLQPFESAAAERDTMMTAKDTASLAAYLLKKYPEVLDVSRRSSVKLANRPERLPSTNLMLSGMPFAFPGNDGLKTGYTTQAGYCFTGTAKQEGRRLVTVVMGADTPEKRFTETDKLFQYGFQTDGLQSFIGHIQSKLGIQVG
ncbi:D-alanyl-D-alanine carboxypeptidase family protein [Paenibacillus paridis]|uniref:D-alanyl-D-alanine carboxypeptidase family protein n=1 Tax=Paenibacillus paridis TaxID=2583376 RepID=UPI001122AB05|nr:D-alanyl-D-alanine carboxypeptidase family protein [Paenibacillus paridis]